MLGAIPHVDVYALTCADEAHSLLSQAIARFADDRKAGKTPRTSVFFLGRETFPARFSDAPNYKLGTAEVLKDTTGEFSKSVTLVVGGSLIAYGLKAAATLAEKHKVGTVLVNPSIINAPDTKTLARALEKTGGRIVCLEDHRRTGGMSAYIAQALLNEGVRVENDFAGRG